jgi:hypothetical protein
LFVFRHTSSTTHRRTPPPPLPPPLPAHTHARRQTPTRLPIPTCGPRRGHGVRVGPARAALLCVRVRTPCVAYWLKLVCVSLAPSPALPTPAPHTRSPMPPGSESQAAAAAAAGVEEPAAGGATADQRLQDLLEEHDKKTAERVRRCSRARLGSSVLPTRPGLAHCPPFNRKRPSTANLLPPPLSSHC